MCSALVRVPHVLKDNVVSDAEWCHQGKAQGANQWRGQEATTADKSRQVYAPHPLTSPTHPPNSPHPLTPPILPATHMSQSSSERTVPTKPLMRSRVQTVLLGGHSNTSRELKCHTTSTGIITTTLKTPTNPTHTQVEQTNPFT